MQLCHNRVFNSVSYFVRASTRDSLRNKTRESCVRVFAFPAFSHAFAPLVALLLAVALFCVALCFSSPSDAKLVHKTFFYKRHIAKLTKLHHAISASGCYNFEGVRMPIPTNFRLPYWQTRLVSYHDSELMQFLQFGWPINYTANCDFPSSTKANHPSATNFPQHVDRFLTTEQNHLAIIGPFSRNPFQPSNFAVSPLQTVPKKGTTDARRVVVDLSFPHNSSVNLGIPKNEYLNQSANFQLPSVDSFLALIQRKGRGCYLYKRDLSRAYRQIAIDPHDYNLLGIQWRNKFFFDTALPFGLRSAAFICQRITTALAYMQRLDGFDTINYIDDFGGAESSYELALEAFFNLANVFKESGINEAPDKAVLPVTDMEFLGIGFNTISFSMYIPESKLQELQEITFLLITSNKISKRQLQSIIGKLMFAAKCVHSARVFMNRLLNALRKLKHNCHRVRVSAAMKRDLFWWSKFLPQFNGTCMIPELHWTEADSVLQCDACPSGAGAKFLDSAFHSTFPEFILSQSLHINALELLVVIVAVKLWAPKLNGSKLTIFCDNSAAVAVINSGFSRDLFMQACLRELVFIISLNGVQIRAVHLPGVDNRAADFLSRWHLDDKFRRLLEYPDLQLVPIDPSLFRFSHTW